MLLKKTVTPVRRAELMDVMVADYGLSVREACRAACLARSAYYAPTKPRDDGPEIDAIEAYIAENRRHRFDKLYPVVRQQGFGEGRLYRPPRNLHGERENPRQFCWRAESGDPKD